MESIRIGGNLNKKGDIIDQFYGIVAGKTLSLTSSSFIFGNWEGAVIGIFGAGQRRSSQGRVQIFVISW